MDNPTGSLSRGYQPKYKVGIARSNGKADVGMHVIIRVRTNQYSGYESVSVYEETLDTEVPKLVRKHKMKYYI